MSVLIQRERVEETYVLSAEDEEAEEESDIADDFARNEEEPKACKAREDRLGDFIEKVHLVAVLCMQTKILKGWWAAPLCQPREFSQAGYC